MNKAQLIDAIAAEANLTKADAKRALDAFIHYYYWCIEERYSCCLSWIWIISQFLKEVPGPAVTHKLVQRLKSAAKKVVKFKAGSELGDAVK